MCDTNAGQSGVLGDGKARYMLSCHGRLRSVSRPAMLRRPSMKTRQAGLEGSGRVKCQSVKALVWLVILKIGTVELIE